MLTHDSLLFSPLPSPPHLSPRAWIPPSRPSARADLALWAHQTELLSLRIPYTAVQSLVGRGCQALKESQQAPGVGLGVGKRDHGRERGQVVTGRDDQMAGIP